MIGHFNDVQKIEFCHSILVYLKYSQGCHTLDNFLVESNQMLLLEESISLHTSSTYIPHLFINCISNLGSYWLLLFIEHPKGNNNKFDDTILLFLNHTRSLTQTRTFINSYHQPLVQSCLLVTCLVLSCLVVSCLVLCCLLSTACLFVNVLQDAMPNKILHATLPPLVSDLCQPPITPGAGCSIERRFVPNKKKILNQK